MLASEGAPPPSDPRHAKQRPWSLLRAARSRPRHRRQPLPISPGSPPNSPATELGVNHFVSGDAGCADPVLAPTAIAFDAKGLDQTENVRIHAYIFRNREAFERLRATVDACAASFVTDPETFERWSNRHSSSPARARGTRIRGRVPGGPGRSRRNRWVGRKRGGPRCASFCSRPPTAPASAPASSCPTRAIHPRAGVARNGGGAAW